MNIYQILGISSDADSKEIRRAYARLIKEFRPETHPVEFGNIREAYEIALARYAEMQAAAEAEAAEQAQQEAEQVANQAAVTPDSAQASSPEELALQQAGSEAIQAQAETMPENPAEATPEHMHQSQPHPVFQYLQALEDCGSARNESKALALTQAFLPSLHDYSLDEYGAIEFEVLNWVFNTQHPMLLAYLELDAFYKWTENEGFGRRDFSVGEIHWLNNLKRAAQMYQLAWQQQDNNLASSGKGLPDCLLAEADINVRRQWRAWCDELGLPALSAYFKPVSNSPYPVRRMHLVYASVSAAITGWLIQEDLLLTLFYSALAFGCMLGIATYLVPLYRIYIMRTATKVGKYLTYFLLFYVLLNVGRVLLSDLDDKVPNNWARDMAREQVQAVADPVQSMVGPTICTGTEQRPGPEYPTQSVRNNETGTAEVLMLVDADGSVLDAQISKSSGHHRLDQAAVEVARRWCFAPLIENGQARKYSIKAPFRFTLSG